MPCLACLFVKAQSIQKDTNVLLPSGYYGCDRKTGSRILAGLKMLVCKDGKLISLCSLPSSRKSKGNDREKCFLVSQEGKKELNLCSVVARQCL